MRKHDGRAMAIRAGLRAVVPCTAIVLATTPALAATGLLSTPRLMTAVIVLGVIGFSLAAVVLLHRARSRAEQGLRDARTQNQVSTP